MSELSGRHNWAEFGFMLEKVAISNKTTELPIFVWTNLVQTVQRYLLLALTVPKSSLGIERSDKLLGKPQDFIFPLYSVMSYGPGKGLPILSTFLIVWEIAKVSRKRAAFPDPIPILCRPF